MIAGGVFFYLIGKILGSNRVSAEVEKEGLDVAETGVPAYPDFVLSTKHN
jgi:ammonia channel protein AmtB